MEPLVDWIEELTANCEVVLANGLELRLIDATVGLSERSGSPWLSGIAYVRRRPGEHDWQLIVPVDVSIPLDQILCVARGPINEDKRPHELAMFLDRDSGKQPKAVAAGRAA